jgi:hypothetical protein
MNFIKYAKSTLTQVKSSVKKFRHAKLIKKYDSNFEDSLFGDLAQQIYIDAHNALMNRDLDNLQSFVTENALPVSFFSFLFNVYRMVKTE